MIKYSKPVYGYVEPSKKARIKRICRLDRTKSESGIIEMGLEKVLGEIEQALGIQEPVQGPRSKKLPGRA